VATSGDNASLARGDSEIDSDDWTLVTLSHQSLLLLADGHTIEFVVEWQADEGNKNKSLGDTTIKSRKEFHIDIGRRVVTIASPLAVGKITQWYKGKVNSPQAFPGSELLRNITVQFDRSGRNDVAAQRLTATLVFDVEVVN
jgi:hypothetical protein